MYNKILVSVSLDHGISTRAIEIAQKLKSEGGQIIAIHVLEPIPAAASVHLSADQLQSIEQLAQEELAKQIDPVTHIEGVILEGHPGHIIPMFALEHDIDCIIMDAHKPEIADYLLGSTAARVVRHAHCAVHILR